MAARKQLEPKCVGADFVFRLFTRSERDPIRLILDVRPVKEFKAAHILLSYSIRLTADGKHLADYSKNSYKIKWSQEVWWNTDVLVVGAPALSSAHPVIAFLAAEGRCRSLSYFKDGVPAFQTAYPFLVGLSTKAHRGLVYPSQIADKQLYLGDWAMAEDIDKLRLLGIKRIITIHNNPDDLKVPADLKHMRIEAADVPSTDISVHFNAAYEFIEAAAAAGHATLVHCGAGVSRSAALSAAYLMRKYRWSADKALRHLLERRSQVCPNEGFWRQLCALEELLGLPGKDRSDVDAPPVVDESYGLTDFAKIAANAAGARVEVRVLNTSRPAAAGVAEARAAADARPPTSGAQGAERRGTREGAPAERDAADRRDAGRARNGSRDREAGRDRGDDRAVDRNSARDGGDRDRRERRRDESRAPPEERAARDGAAHRDHRDLSRAADDRDRKRSRIDEAARGGAEDRGALKARTREEHPGARNEAPAADVGGKSGAPAAPGLVMAILKNGEQVGMLEVPVLKRHQRCVFGRAPDSDVKLEHASISRHHAELTVDALGNLFLCDLGSGHGSNVNGVWARPNAPKELKVGSQFRFGASTRTYAIKSINVTR